MPDTEILLMVFIGITALAVLLQAFVLLGLYVTVRKAVRVGQEQADEYRSKITPVLEGSNEIIKTAKDLIGSVRSLITNLRTPLESVAAEWEGMTRDLHAQANRLQASLDESVEKARHQVDRVDGMATSMLNGLDRFGSFLNEAVHVPIRQVNGVIAAARAVVETLRAPVPPRPPRAPQPANVTEDKDLFV